MNEPVMGGPILRTSGLGKTFDDGRLRLEVLREVDLEVRRGERVAIVGATGTGKSTLLHCLGGLDAPSAGEVWVSGERMSTLTDAARSFSENLLEGLEPRLDHIADDHSEGQWRATTVNQLPNQHVGISGGW